MPRRRLRCFVAMAFGHDETDALYDRAIKPSILKAGVVPVRVDRKEHNRNINDFIMSELERSDVAIADLSYARPSVYFEAGFAERKVPVIYTVRSDHFGRGGDNPELRVHFDVAMRNIIPWRAPLDPKFAAALAKRLNYVLKPLRLSEKLDAERESQEALFSSQPIEDQRTCIELAARSFLVRRGYREEPRATARSEQRFPGEELFRPTYHTVAGHLHRTISFVVRQKFRPSELRALTLKMFPTNPLSGPQNESHCWFIFLDKVPFASFRRYFQKARADNIRKCLSFSVDMRHHIFATNKRRKGFEHRVYVHLIDRVRSKADLLERLLASSPFSERKLA